MVVDLRSSSTSSSGNSGSSREFSSADHESSHPVYVFLFDNTFSWYRGKCVKYQVTVSHWLPAAAAVAVSPRLLCASVSVQDTHVATQNDESAISNRTSTTAASVTSSNESVSHVSYQQPSYTPQKQQQQQHQQTSEETSKEMSESVLWIKKLLQFSQNPSTAQCYIHS